MNPINQLNGKTINESDSRVNEEKLSNKLYPKKPENNIELPPLDYIEYVDKNDLNLNGEDYDYLTLLQKQAEIVNHLKEIEDLNYLKKTGARNHKPLDDFTSNDFDPLIKNKAYMTTKTTYTIKKSSKKMPILFHGSYA